MDERKQEELDRAWASLREEIMANRWTLGITFAGVYLLMASIFAIGRMFTGW